MKPDCILFLLVSALSLAGSAAMAQNSLTVPMEVVRVNNPNLVAEGGGEDDGADGGSAARRGSVTLFRIHPEYTLHSARDGSRTELTLGGLIERSSNTDLSAHRSLPSVSVLWEGRSPTGVFGLRASLMEESTRETEFADFGRVALDTTQRIGTLGANWSKGLTSNTTLELEAAHARVKYDTPLIRDYNETSMGAAHHWQYSADTRYSLTAAAARLRQEGRTIPSPDDEGAGRASRAGIGLAYEARLSEDLALVGSVGAVRTRALRGTTHPVGGLRLSYDGETIDYTLAWLREVSVSGAFGGYLLVETVETSLTYPFTVNTSLSVGAGHARSLEMDREAGTTVFARVRSELTPFWALTIGLEHRRVRTYGGPSARGHSVALGLVYSHPDF